MCKQTSISSEEVDNLSSSIERNEENCDDKVSENELHVELGNENFGSNDSQESSSNLIEDR